MSEAQPAAEAAPPEAGARNRHTHLAIYGVFCLGVTALLLALYSSWAPIGTVRGKVLGEAERVTLADVARDSYRKGRLTSEGYEVDLPPFVKEPRVFVYGKGPNPHEVRSGVVEVKEGVQEVPTLALWETPLEITVRDGTVRFDWSPIPTGEGFPKRASYSLLVTYSKVASEDMDKGDTSLLCKGPKRSISLYELEQLFQQFDVEQRELEVELRARDLGQNKGAIWVGARRKWTFPPTTPPEPLTPMGSDGLPPGGERPR